MNFVELIFWILLVDVRWIEREEEELFFFMNMYRYDDVFRCSLFRYYSRYISFFGVFLGLELVDIYKRNICYLFSFLGLISYLYKL